MTDIVILIKVPRSNIFSSIFSSLDFLKKRRGMCVSEAGEAAAGEMPG